ncbi:hypothetical protein OS493_028033 [Desmophyllum pertusum]|uniref:Uncharacterized protein n=1 Tax=Desmophyllum pertusum TaxID=174260 RepID=A0A9X0A1M7_9CNID|nr:hypothetical protein OS493_028033 [Desmophyllum pertusum]
MDSKTLSSTSLPCLNKKDVTSNCSTRYSKKLGMASEPLLPLTDSERPETEDLECSEDVPDKAAITACKGPHLLDTENGTSSVCAEYCFFCTQQGPVITRENVSDDQKSKKKTKSQSLLVLNSFGSKSRNSPRLLADSCDNLTQLGAVRHQF